MSIPGSATPLLLATTAAAPAAAFQIDRSLRFNSADSSYLSRTPSSAGNRKTFTFSCWLKKGTVTDSQRVVFSAFGGSGNAYVSIDFRHDSPRFLGWNGSSVTFEVKATRVFRDPSAWYHMVWAVDTTQATAADRAKLYINGVQETDFQTSSYPSQNTDLYVNTTNQHEIGQNAGTSQAEYDGYLAEINFVDGQALAPTDFAETDSNNNWNPKDTSGLTFGTNGFHLDFADSADLGDDNSGNGNDWTPNNLVGAATVWSSYGDGNSYWAATVFDSTTTETTFPGNTTMTWNANAHPTGITWSTSLKIRYLKNSNGGPFVFNGTTLTLSNTGHLNWTTVDISSQVTSPLTTISLSRPSSGSSESAVVAIYADDVLVTDQSASDIDSLIDTPTNYDAASGNNGGNYATMNPVGQTKTEYFTENGNLVCGNSSVPSGSSGSRGFVPSTIGFKTGKWYAEVQTTAASDGDVDFAVGIFPVESTGYYSTSGHYALRPTGHLYSPAGVHQSYGTGAWTDDDIIGIAVDMDSSTKTIQWFKNGTAIASATTIVANEYFFGYGSDGGGGSRTYRATWNFGQRSFQYTPPTNHKSLCTQNLPDPTIADGSTAMDVVTRSGGGVNQSFTTLRPGLVWEKRRETDGFHYLFDVNRGNDKYLSSNATTAEGSSSGAFTFNANSYVVSSGFDWPSSASIVDWVWDAGTSTVSNTDGSITSSVRANASAGFSIATYTGTGTAGTIGHGLNAAPSLVIAKSRSATGRWAVYSSATGAGNKLYLDGTDASASSSNWNNTAPTSSVFSVGSSVETNTNTVTSIAYCFSPVSQYSAFGSYTGSGNNDGSFIYTGFAVRWLLIKCTSTSGQEWVIIDSARSPFNVADDALYANDSAAEATNSTRDVDLLSSGFKLRNGSSGATDFSERTYIYMAFAEHPFKTARAR